jgi:hypothetical protein
MNQQSENKDVAGEAGRPHRWKKGESGNPRGRPRGARHRATVLMEKLMLADAETIVRAVIDAAGEGNMTAARIVIERLMPPAKDRPIAIELPDTGTAEGCEAAQAAIVAAVTAGELLASEGASLSALVEARRRAIETVEHARRIEALEAAISEGQE